MIITCRLKKKCGVGGEKYTYVYHQIKFDFVEEGHCRMVKKKLDEVFGKNGEKFFLGNY